MIGSRLQTLRGAVDAGPTDPRRTIPLEIVLRSWMFAMGSVGVDPSLPLIVRRRRRLTGALRFHARLLLSPTFTRLCASSVRPTDGSARGGHVQPPWSRVLLPAFRVGRRPALTTARRHSSIGRDHTLVRAQLQDRFRLVRRLHESANHSVIVERWPRHRRLEAPGSATLGTSESAQGGNGDETVARIRDDGRDEAARNRQDGRKSRARERHSPRVVQGTGAARRPQGWTGSRATHGADHRGQKEKPAVRNVRNARPLHRRQACVIHSSGVDSDRMEVCSAGAPDHDPLCSVRLLSRRPPALTIAVFLWGPPIRHAAPLPMIFPPDRTRRWSINHATWCSHVRSWR